MAAGQIDKLGRNEAISLAKKMRQRARNLSMDKQRMSQRAIAVGVGAVSAYGVGMWMGSKMHDFLELGGPGNSSVQAAEDALKADASLEDPRKIAGIDADLLLGLAATGLGVSGLAGRQASDLIEAAGAGVLAGYAYSKGAQAGLESARGE